MGGNPLRFYPIRPEFDPGYAWFWTLSRQCHVSNDVACGSYLSDIWRRLSNDSLPRGSSDMSVCAEGITESILRRLIPNPPVSLIDTEESDDVAEVIFEEEQFLRQQSTVHVTPPLLAYTPPPPFLATMEPLDTLLMGDEVINTTPARENDEFIKSSVDDLVSIPREFEVTLVY
ncbi:hypothetical protein Tco_1012277 [Tanacetum coccineum]